MKILLNGCKGRMGAAILEAAKAAGAEISAACDIGAEFTAADVAACDVAVDFSFHEVTPALAEACAVAGKPLVIGTTGHTPAERARIEAVAQKIAVVWAGNYSVGVNVLNWLVGKAAQLLDASFEVELVEMHHHHKKDAPSGTAEKLLSVIEAARGSDKSAERHGRAGLVGARSRGEIGVHALRGGSVVGDHTVIFAGEGERVELAHKAESRAIFANGAVHAAQWLAAGKAPGIYGMDAVLGLDKA